jgi:competence protein ComEC
MAGLHTMVEEFDVGNFNVGALTFASRSYQSLAQAVAGRGIPIEGHRAGERFAVGDVAVEILWPGADYAPEKGPSNNDSLVLRLCRLDRCLLLPGDIEPKLEKKLAQSASRLRAGAVKVPHHGGVGTAGEEFLAAIRPQVAVVSVGARNPHEHPRAEVLERLAASSQRVYRTDRDGSITLQLTRTEFRAASFRERQRTRPYPNLWAKLLVCAHRIARLESTQWAVSNTN